MGRMTASCVRLKSVYRVAYAAIVLMIALAPPALTDEFEVRDAWAQPVAGSKGRAVEVYFTLVNTGRMAFLAGVEADGGIAQFCTAEGSAATGTLNECGQIDRMMLAGDDSFVFDRRDVFVVLSNLSQTPMPGEEVTVRLVFADGTKVTVTAPLVDRET